MSRRLTSLTLLLLFVVGNKTFLRNGDRIIVRVSEKTLSTRFRFKLKFFVKTVFRVFRPVELKKKQKMRPTNR